MSSLEKYENLSDGSKDGFVVLFCKEGKIRPIMLTEEQATLLNISLKVPFNNNSVVLGKGNVNIENGTLKDVTSDEKNKYELEYEYKETDIVDGNFTGESLEGTVVLELNEHEKKNESFVKHQIYLKTKKEPVLIFKITKL